VVSCADADSGLLAAERSPPAAVILDLLMPGMDGFQFLDRFRRKPQHRRVPVIVWTMKDLTTGELARLSASATFILQKGEGRLQLVEALQAALPQPG
jgi:CheY-like chemotaxis protein